MKVWRYVLELPEQGEELAEGAEQAIPVGAPGSVVAVSCEMEPGAEILEFTLSSKGLTLYALVEGTGVTEERHFVLVGNDAELPDSVAGAVAYRDTVKILGGPTLHLFDATPVAVEA